MTTLPGSSDVSSVTTENHQVGNERPISLRGTEAYTAFKTINLLAGFQITTDKMQRLFDLFISTDALHVSGGSSAHHQEHITVHTASGIVNQYWYLLLSLMRWNFVPAMCSWWWAEEPPETCRASVEISKSRNVESCCLQFGIIFTMYGHTNIKLLAGFAFIGPQDTSILVTTINIFSRNLRETPWDEIKHSY